MSKLVEFEKWCHEIMNLHKWPVDDLIAEVYWNDDFQNLELCHITHLNSSNIQLQFLSLEKDSTVSHLNL